MLRVAKDDSLARSLVETWGLEVVGGDNGWTYFRVDGLDRVVEVTSALNQPSGKLRLELGRSRSTGELQVQLILPAPITASRSEQMSMLARLQGDPMPRLIRKQLPGRGGTVVHGLLPAERIVTCASEIQHLPGNVAIRRATGLAQVCTCYGTSWGASNTFELLQTLKVAHTLGTPAVFDNYESAMTTGFYSQRAMRPSFTALGVDMGIEDLGIDKSEKFTAMLDSSVVEEVFAVRGLAIGTIAAGAAEGQSIAGWYRRASWLLAQRFLSLLGLAIPISTVRLEEVLAQGGYWLMTVGQLARVLQERSGHPVGLFHQQSGRLVRTDEYSLPVQWTVAKLHEEGGWLSGAAIYWMLYDLGRHGGLVVPIFDGERGNVHLLARQPLEQSENDLRIMPVNLLWLPAEGQIEDGCIDPWALMELFERWGEVKSRRIAQQLWDLIETPLPMERIGRKTWAYVGLDGLRVVVT